MAIIIKRMKMPESCNNCLIGRNDACKNWRQLKVDEQGIKRSDGCPLKTTQGLMKRLEDESNKRKDSLFGDGIRYCLDIIKEYCEEEEA